MERFTRTVFGYHGCSTEFAHQMLLGQVAISTWRLSQNQWDWLGDGIYFWEYSPARASRWAHERQKEDADVIGAIIQLDRCFDLLDESCTLELSRTYQQLKRTFTEAGKTLPVNRGRRGKLRQLDRLVINNCLESLTESGIEYNCVRGGFLEGDLVYPGAGFASESHIQIAVRDPACIVGLFRPTG